MHWMPIFVAVVLIGGLLHLLIDLLERKDSKCN